MQCRTVDGKACRVLVVIDEFSRECLALYVARSIRAEQVMHVLADLFLEHGTPDNLRSDNGSEFVAIALRNWLSELGAQTQYIEPGSPWENGYCESFNGKLRDKLLNGEVFTTLKEAEIIIEAWRRHYNTRRPHRSLGGRPPAPMTIFAPPMGGAMGPLTPPHELTVLTLLDTRAELCH